MGEKDIHKNIRYAALVALAGWAILVMFKYYQEHQLGFRRLYRLLVDYQPPPLPTDPLKIMLAIKHLSLACLLALIGMLAGRRLLRMAGISNRELHPENKWGATQDLMLALGLGWGLLIYATLFLGGVGGLYAAVIGGLCLVVLLVCLRDVPALFGDIKALFEFDRSEKSSPLIRIGTAWMIVVLVFIAIMAVAPSITHDAMVYHLGVPRVYADAHRIVTIPFDLFSNTLLNMEMLYTSALLIDDFILANLLHYILGAATLIFFYGFVRCNLGSTTAILATLIFFFNPSFLNEMPLAYGDLGMTFYFLLATACFWNWRVKGDRRWFFMLCIFAGVFAGMKYTSIYGLVALSAMVAMAGRSSGDRKMRTAVINLALFGGIVTLFVSPYLVKNYLITGNPVYPVMYNMFGGRWLVDAQVERMLSYVHSHGMGHDWRNMLALPWNITVMGNPGFENFDTTITPLWLIFVPAFVFIRPKPPLLRWAALACAVCFLSWAASTHITRYMMPIFPLLSLLCAHTIIDVGEKAASLPARLSSMVKGGILLACGIVWFSFSFFYPPLVPAKFGPVVWGEQTRDEFLTEAVRNYSVFKYINEELPADAHLILFWDNRRFFCDRSKIGDSVLEAPRMIELVHEAGSPDAFRRMLEEMGITHVYFNHLFYSWFPPHTISEEDARRFQNDFKNFKAFLEKHCEPLFTGDWATVYVLRE